MKLTKATEYGILTLLHLAKQPAGRLSDTAHIAEAERIPSSFLSKLIPSLVKAGLVRSHRGSHGGLELGRSAKVITLRQIVEATEGEIAVNECTAAAPSDCYRVGCSIQSALKVAQAQFLLALEGFTLAELARTDAPPAVRLELPLAR